MRYAAILILSLLSLPLTVYAQSSSCPVDSGGDWYDISAQPTWFMRQDSRRVGQYAWIEGLGWYTTTDEYAYEEPYVPAFYFKVYLSRNKVFDSSDILLKSYYVAGRKGGSSAPRLQAKVQIPRKTGPGKYYLLSVADPARTTKDCDRSNNTETFGPYVISK